MSEIRIPLARPMPGHNGEVRELVMREPTFNDFMDLGDPYQIAQSPEGSNFAIVDPEVVRGYFQRMLVEPKHPETPDQRLDQGRAGGAGGDPAFFPGRRRGQRTLADLADDLAFELDQGSRRSGNCPSRS